MVLDIQICNARPVPDIDLALQAEAVPVAVRSFYKVNGINRFQIDRPFHRGEKNNKNEFQVCT